MDPRSFPRLPAAVREDVKRVGRWELKQEGPRRGGAVFIRTGNERSSSPCSRCSTSPNTITCERRSSTTVPTQALTLMNNEFVLIQSRHLAERIQKMAGEGLSEQVKMAYVWR